MPMAQQANPIPAKPPSPSEAPRQQAIELLVQKYEAAFCIVMATFVFLWQQNGGQIFPHMLFLLEILLAVNLAAVWFIKRWPTQKLISAAVVSINMALVTGILAFSGGVGSNFWIVYLLPIYTSCLLLDGKSVTWIAFGAISFNVAYYVLSVPVWSATAYFELSVKCGILLFTAVSTWAIVKRGRQSQKLAEEKHAEAQSHANKLLRVQRTLEWSEETAPLYQSLVHQLDDAISIADAETARFLDVNDAACRNLGYSREELLRMRVIDAVPMFPDMEAWRAHVAQLRVQGQQTVELKSRRKDGTFSIVEATVKLVPHEGKEYNIAVVRDISARKAAESRTAVQYKTTEILSRSESLRDAAPEILKALGTGLEWRAGALWQADASLDVLKCAEFWQADSLRAPEFEAITRRSSFDHGVDLPGRVWTSGKPSWIEDLSKESLSPRAYCAAQNGLRCAFAFPVNVGSTIVGVIEFLGSDIRSPEAELLEFIEALGRQVGQFVEKKAIEAQLRQSEEQLRLSQKMEAIGQLAGGVAHEFNNILTSIIGLSQLQMARLPESDLARADFAEIKQAGERGAALTSRLLAFGRRQVIQPRELNLNEIVGNTKEFLSGLVGENISVSAALEDRLAAVRGDAGQIEQALAHLVVNAREAMPKGGAIVITTANVLLKEPLVVQHDAVPAGSYVALSVEDTGAGMKPEVLAHLFEPFFTTKPRGRSSGLGLSTVYGIVKQSGGFIAVNSVEGKGTRFTIYFPQAAAHSVAAPAAKTAEKSGAATILLVEDEDSVRALARRILLRDGYRLIEASSGDKAVSLGTERDGLIDLLITDVVMPGLNGRLTALRLKEARPDLKVIYMSGYTDQAIIAEDLAKPGVFFLQKPFDVATFSRTVRQALDA